jgi:hypothetical protein
LWLARVGFGFLPGDRCIRDNHHKARSPRRWRV